MKHLRTRRKRHLYLAILFGVITSYSYVYFSSYLYLFWIIFALSSALLKRWHDVKSTAIASGITLTLAAPFWISSFGFSNEELTQVTLLTKTHAPILTPQVFFILFLCGTTLILINTSLIRQRPGVIIFSLLFSAIGILNHRIFTGLEVQSWHYQIHILPQVTILAFVVIITELHHKFPMCHLRKPLNIRILLGLSGIGLILLNMIISPEFICNHLSSDGTLSSISQNILNIGRIVGRYCRHFIH